MNSSLFGGGGGTSAASVKAPAGCAWAAASQADWIRIDAGPTGSGDGTVSFTVSVYGGAEPRTGELTIAKQTFTVTQNACDLRVQPTQVTFADTVDQTDVSIEVDDGCPWKVRILKRQIDVSPCESAVRRSNSSSEASRVVHIDSIRCDHSYR